MFLLLWKETLTLTSEMWAVSLTGRGMVRVTIVYFLSEGGSVVEVVVNGFPTQSLTYYRIRMPFRVILVKKRIRTLRNFVCLQ